MQAVVDSNQTLHFEKAIRNYLTSDCAPDTRIGVHAFDIVLPAKDVNFTDVALQVLRQVPGAAGPQRYAIAHGENVPAVQFTRPPP